MRKIIYLLLLLCNTTIFVAQAQSFAERTATHRKQYIAAFLNDNNSPLKQEDLVNLHFYDADSSYRISADITLLKDQKPFQMPTYDGTSKEFIRYALVSFQLEGKSLQMTLYKSPSLAINPVYKNYLFLPFTDESNGKTTYGGGRYIDLSINDINNGKIEIDFNRAYNPYCAYSSGYRCPVPPQENDLALEIRAGEKLFTGTHKSKDKP